MHIANLRKKVIAIFDELQSENRLKEHNFKDSFMSNYPKDYALIEHEYRFEVHEFRKNKRGHPKPFPNRPDVVLSKIYRHYYFTVIKYKAIQDDRAKVLNLIRCKVGKKGYKIKTDDNKHFDVIKKSNKEVIAEGISFAELKGMFPIKK